MDNRCEIVSNDESGDGRFDIGMYPRQRKLPGIIMELKFAKGTTTTKLKKLADDALTQIEGKMYDTTMRSRGVERIFEYGVAFSGKNVGISIAEICKCKSPLISNDTAKLVSSVALVLERQVLVFGMGRHPDMTIHVDMTHRLASN